MALNIGSMPCMSQRISRIPFSRPRKSTFPFPNTEALRENEMRSRRSNTSAKRSQLSQTYSRYMKLAQHHFASVVDVLRAGACSKISRSVCSISNQTPANGSYSHGETSHTVVRSDESGATILTTKLDMGATKPRPKSVHKFVTNKVLARTHTMVLPPTFVKFSGNRTIGQTPGNIDLTDFLLNLQPNAGPIIERADPIALVNRMLPASIIPPGARFVAACFWSWLCVVDGAFPCSLAVLPPGEREKLLRLVLCACGS